jgi:hydroxymethylglutaryl-CoA lyase
MDVGEDAARAVQVVEVAARDGLQNEARLLPTATKLALIERLVTAGLRRLEVASFVHPRLVPAMADAEAVVAGLATIGGRSAWSAIGLILNERGLQRALATAVDEVNVVVAASDGFAERNNGCSAHETAVRAAAVVTAARAAGRATTVTVSTAFGCPFDGEVDPGRVESVVEQLAAAEPDEIALADTIGVGVPRQVGDLVARARRAAPDVRLRAHFHNTRNTGYANAFAAVEAGVHVLDASAGGIGGCPFAPNATGNIATEDLCFALERSGVATGVDVDAVAAIGTWIATTLGHDAAPALVGRAGGFPPGR